MSRAIWKGAIAFGLLRIPVRLLSAERRSRPAFHMLDRRDHAHIGYRRVNEQTGREVPWEEVVSGYEYERGKFVELTDEELREVTPSTFRTVRIEDFVHRNAVPPLYFGKPYLLAPEPAGRRAYALLRTAIEQTNTLAVCRTVIQTREHLTGLFSYFGVLSLVMMRYHNELLPAEEIDVPRGGANEQDAIGRRELDDAQRLIEAMSVEWNPVRYPDHYSQHLVSWIERRIREERRGVQVAEEEEIAARQASLLDIDELLKRSIERRRNGGQQREHQRPTNR